MTRRRVCWIVAASLLVLPGALEGLYRAGWALARSAGGTDAFELYIVGESTAAGEPYSPRISPAQLVSARFGGRLLGRRVRVVTVALPGESIYPQSVRFDWALRRRDAKVPGAVLIYSGHNDAGTRRGIPRVERWRHWLAERSFLAEDGLYLLERRGLLPKARTADTYAYFLRRTAAAARRSGLTPVLSTVMGNLSGVEPGLSSPSSGASVETVALLDEGTALESKGRHAQALRLYETAAVSHPWMRAYLAYRMGRCRLALGEYAKAKGLFQEAVDRSEQDNFGRASSLQNDLVRGLASEESIPLVDAESVFEEHSPHGISGDSLFADGQHPNIEGYLLLADAYAGRLSEVLHDPLRRPPMRPKEVFEAFAFGREEQARALVASGVWLLTVASGHAYPADRLRLARERFEGALALAPGSFPAQYGLGLVDAAQRSDLLKEPAGRAWLGAHRVYYGGLDDVDAKEIGEVAEKLRACGVPEDRLAAMLAAFRRFSKLL